MEQEADEKSENVCCINEIKEEQNDEVTTNETNEERTCAGERSE
jgi:hypothetical protein